MIREESKPIHLILNVTLKDTLLGTLSKEVVREESKPIHLILNVTLKDTPLGAGQTKVHKYGTVSVPTGNSKRPKQKVKGEIYHQKGTRE